MSAQTLGPIEAAIEQSRFKKSYDALTPAMLALKPAELRTVNIDIRSATTLVLTAIPKVLARRDEFVKQFPLFPIELMDTLEQRTLALDYANSNLLASAKQLEPIGELVERGAARRTLLVGEVRYAALHGLVDDSPLDAVGGNTGHRGLASDLFTLSLLIRNNWARLEGKTQLTLAQISEAEQIADHLIMAVGARTQPEHGFDPSADMRGRAFTLFIVAYEQVRKWMATLFEDEIDRILPQIHQGRGPGKKQLTVEQIQEEIRTATGVHPVVKESEAEAAEAQPDEPPLAAAAGKRGSSPYSS
jgi:hypothetical protein